MPETIKPYEGSIVKNGTALQVTIPQHIVRYLELDRGDKLKVELTLLERLKKNKESTKKDGDIIQSGYTSFDAVVL